MRIVDLLNKDSILLNGAPKSKTEAIDMLVDLQMKSGNISDREIYKQGILAREEKGSTAVGEGIAVKSNMVYTLCKHMVYMLSITNEHKK